MGRDRSYEMMDPPRSQVLDHFGFNTHIDVHLTNSYVAKSAVQSHENEADQEIYEQWIWKRDHRRAPAYLDSHKTELQKKNTYR
jgi:hypothetical protein